MKLKRPIMFDGQEISELTLDLDALTGNDLINAEARLRKELLANGEMVISPELDTRYLLLLAAQAANTPPEALRLLSANDFTAVVGEVRGFLFSDQPDTPETPAA